ncbi:GNAT family N-acetyltransferase [Sphingopyxis sp.]|uniref:GNAT family N-acetyltransferase n=1 Tax=Sphingopyxis sp. TaxID=1908224 RepID=UPI00262A83C0|nr:GNAT family N-acetyltransferase [Sphingopyxis sp.]MCW0199828.1 GNAT family N-acetyltransferase [Sphingopyxis sp.]
MFPSNPHGERTAMKEEIGPDELRAMAEHRGMKLVRSRKRTPGVGDYGKYGLTNASGKPLLGIGEAGLTASAEEVEEYLRGGTLSSWKLSAETTPDAKTLKKKIAVADRPDDEGPMRRRTSSSPRRSQVEVPKAPARREPLPADRPARAKPALRIVPKEPPPPEKNLVVRPAKTADAAPVAKLMNQLAGPKADKARVTANMELLRKSRGQLLVAEQGAVIGCCAWAVVPTIQRGPIGRITLLLVDKPERRSGVGTALLSAAEGAIAKAGCREIEAMSDIMVNNAHNFFRSLKFEQKSYRFVRIIEGRSSDSAPTR